MTKFEKKSFYTKVNHTPIAVRQRLCYPSKFHIMWFGGYRSNMLSTKAVALDTYAKNSEISCTRWDYSGHGESGGDFFQASFTEWLEQAEQIYEYTGRDAVIFVGSSLGGWISLYLAQKLLKLRKKTPIGIILIAPALDFTKSFFKDQSTTEVKSFVQKDDFFLLNDGWNYLMPITRHFIENSKKYYLLEGLIQTEASIHILHGLQDDVVKDRDIIKLLEHLPTEGVTWTSIADGDHRLSRREDISCLYQKIDEIILHAKTSS